MHFFLKADTPPPPRFGLQLEQHALLLLLALLLQWMDAEPTVNDQAHRTLGSCMPPVTFSVCAI